MPNLKKDAWLAEHVPGGMVECLADDALTIVGANEEFYRLFGYTREELDAHKHGRYLELVHPSDRARLMQGSAEMADHAVTLEYRAIRRDGTVFWVHDRCRRVTGPDGEPRLCGVLLDVTEGKTAQEELRLSLERHRVILGQTNDIIFEWEIGADRLVCASNWEKRFGYPPRYERLDSAIAGSDAVHPADRAALLRFRREAAAGAPYQEGEFRFRTAAGEYRWCRVRMTTQFSAEGVPVKAIGVVLDVDEERRRTERLLEQAQKDALTGLFNRGAVCAAIERRLQAGGGRHALLLLDIDDFKRVNDHLGHLCGDAVLSDMAVAIKNAFREPEVAGRIGGDEFLVFLPDIGGRAEAMERAETLCALARSVRERLGLGSVISSSVGVALYPDDAHDYNGLFRCADCALYYVKKHDKNACAAYAPEMERKDGVAEGAAGSRIEFGAAGSEAGLASYCFRMLARTDELQKSISRMLELVGRVYEASRVYVFEVSEDGRYCSNTFEWCNDGVQPEIDTLQNIDLQNEAKGYTDLFDENRLFICPDISCLPPHLQLLFDPQEIRSVLQYAMVEDGAFCGFVGFDQCRESPYWTREQIESVETLMSVLAMFVRVLHMKERLRALEQQA